jgi:hypothetical protein
MGKKKDRSRSRSSKRRHKSRSRSRSRERKRHSYRRDDSCRREEHYRRSRSRSHRRDSAHSPSSERILTAREYTRPAPFPVNETIAEALAKKRMPPPAAPAPPKDTQDKDVDARSVISDTTNLVRSAGTLRTCVTEEGELEEREKSLSPDSPRSGSKHEEEFDEKSGDDSSDSNEPSFPPEKGETIKPKVKGYCPKAQLPSDSLLAYVKPVVTGADPEIKKIPVPPKLRDFANEHFPGQFLGFKEYKEALKNGAHPILDDVMQEAPCLDPSVVDFAAKYKISLNTRRDDELRTVQAMLGHMLAPMTMLMHSIGHDWELDRAGLVNTLEHCWRYWSACQQQLTFFRRQAVVASIDASFKQGTKSGAQLLNNKGFADALRKTPLSYDDFQMGDGVSGPRPNLFGDPLWSQLKGQASSLVRLDSTIGTLVDATHGSGVAKRKKQNMEKSASGSNKKSNSGKKPNWRDHMHKSWSGFQKRGSKPQQGGGGSKRYNNPGNKKNQQYSNRGRGGYRGRGNGRQFQQNPGNSQPRQQSGGGSGE